MSYIRYVHIIIIYYKSSFSEIIIQKICTVQIVSVNLCIVLRGGIEDELVGDMTYLSVEVNVLELSLFSIVLFCYFLDFRIILITLLRSALNFRQ